MSEVNLRMQYNESSVVIYEIDDGERFKVAKWDETDMEQSDNLAEIIGEYRDMVETTPKAVIRKIHGSVDAWETLKEQQKSEQN